MNKTELIAAVAEKSELSKKDAEKAINAVVSTIVDALKADEKVSIVGFGAFEAKTRPQSGNRQGDRDRCDQGGCVQGRQSSEGRSQLIVFYSRKRTAWRSFFLFIVSPCIDGRQVL